MKGNTAPQPNCRFNVDADMDHRLRLAYQQPITSPTRHAAVELPVDADDVVHLHDVAGLHHDLEIGPRDHLFKPDDSM